MAAGQAATQAPDGRLREAACSCIPRADSNSLRQDRQLLSIRSSWPHEQSNHELRVARVDARVHRQAGAAGNYGNTSEHIRDPVCRDQEEQAKKRLRDLIEEGLASGLGRRRTEAGEKELLAVARGELD
jgi:antitoxin ParD1/3/4